MSFTAAGFELIALAIDIALYVHVRNTFASVPDVTDDTSAGAGLWITLAVLILLLVSGTSVFFSSPPFRHLFRLPFHCFKPSSRQFPVKCHILTRCFLGSRLHRLLWTPQGIKEARIGVSSLLQASLVPQVPPLKQQRPINTYTPCSGSTRTRKRGGWF